MVRALHRRTVLLSEGGGGRHDSAPGDSRTRSPAAEQHCLLPRDELGRAQGGEEGYGHDDEHYPSELLIHALRSHLHGRKKANGDAVTARRGRGDRVRHAITASGNRVTTFGCTPQVSRQHACRCSLRPDRGCLTFSRRWGVLTVRHRASSRGLWLPSTSMHQARIILAVYGFEASVAQAPALRQTTAHPEPERVVTEACAWAGRFHPTDGPHSRRARSKGQCGIHGVNE